MCIFKKCEYFSPKFFANVDPFGYPMTGLIILMTTIYAVVKVNGVHVVNDCDIPMFMVLIRIQCVNLVGWTSFSIVHQSRKHVCQWQAHLNRGHSIHRSHQIPFNIQLCLGDCHLLIAHCLKWCSILVIMPEFDERSSR